jgi:hypothetical protein
VLGLGLTALVGLARVADDDAASASAPAGAPSRVLDGSEPAAAAASTRSADTRGSPRVPAALGALAPLESDVVALTHARAAALAAGDLLGLLRVTVPGSPAALADLDRFADRPAAQGRAPGSAPSDAPEGAEAGPVGLRVERVSVLEPDDDGHRVLLVAAVGPVGTLDAVPARGVVLSLAGDAGAWRVRDVTGAPADAP